MNIVSFFLGQLKRIASAADIVCWETIPAAQVDLAKIKCHIGNCFPAGRDDVAKRPGQISAITPLSRLVFLNQFGPVY